MNRPILSQSDEIHVIPYNWANDTLRSAIALLQYRVAPGGTPPPGDPPSPEHDPALHALSFYLVADQRVVSYAGVVHKQIQHANDTFQIAGLSCVATDPAWQGQGLGSRTVGAASRAIAHSQIDIGLFTCDPPLAAFYARAGDWPLADNVVLIGSRHANALSSVALHKVVLIRLFSDKAQAAADRLRNTTINLDLPVGQFL